MNVGAFLGAEREPGSARIAFNSPARSPFVVHSTSSTQCEVPRLGDVGAVSFRASPQEREHTDEAENPNLASILAHDDAGPGSPGIAAAPQRGT